MYCEYWNLNKPPFDNVPDSSMYVDCHESMEDVISETIFAIKEGNECFAVIVGDVGVGKTLSLRIIIDSLEPEKYKVALITNPSLSFIQLLREIIGQITGKQCQETTKVDLLEIFNRLLFETNDQGKKIVIVIDESNVLSSRNLDDLRLLTNMQDDDRNLFTLILAGQMELAQKLEHPKRANLFQRVGTYGHIEKLPSEETVQTYIESRLRLAGTQEKIFADDAIPVIWEFSEHGVPRLINKICKLCLKAGETNEFKMISGEIASQIADRFQKLSKFSFQKHKTQSPPEIELPQENIPEQPEVLAVEKKVVPSDEPEVKELKKKPKSSTPRKAASKVKASLKPIPSQPEATTAETEAASPTRAPSVSVPPEPEIIAVEEKVVPIVEVSSTPVPSRLDTTTDETIALPPKQATAVPLSSQPEVVPFEKKVIPPLRASAEDIPLQGKAKAAESKVVPLARTSTTYVPLQQEAKVVETKTVPPIQASSTPETNEEQPIIAEQEVYEEVLIGKQKVKMSIPDNVIRQAKLANTESKNKLAGYWSAQVIKENPHVMHSPLIDPVSIWFEIKSVILNKFNGTSY
ncbi:MAG: AAA family ATPase [Smithella sp.]|jgi:type II secretory pathway predicted ATPase ExeA